MRQWAVLFLGMSILLAFNAYGQHYPNRAVRVIVPLPPGGATDVIIRPLAQKLGEAMGQTFFIDQRAGGGQIIGTDLAAKSKPDGYTLLLVSVTHSTNPSLYTKLPYDSVKDFTAVSLLASSALVLLVHPSLPAKSVKELIALARINPSGLNYASGGNGSGGHLAAELFKSMARVNLTHIPYKGGGLAYVDLVAGQVPIMFTSPAATRGFVKSGRLRALATTGTSRAKATPELPTVSEAALPGFEANLWYGMLAPASTAQDIVLRLNSEIVKALQHSDLRDQYLEAGVEPTQSMPEQFRAYIEREIAKWSKVIKAANIRTG